MNPRSLISAALIGVLLFTCVPSRAQGYEPVPVTISKDKVRGSDGKVYYSHVVLERQTLFSISKAYAVTVDDIYAANPSLKKEGLKKDDIIWIPVNPDAGKVQETVPEEPAGETVVTETVTVPEATQDQEEDWFIHVVKWYENINDISSKYGIPADDILSFNGLEPGKKIKSRTKLKIPRNTAGSAEEISVLELPGNEEVAAGQEIPGEETDIDDPGESNGFPLFGRKNKISATLMLPLAASGKASSNHFDFYSGVLLAVRDLGAEGISTDLNVFDIASGISASAAEKISESDVVIGPVSASDLSKVLQLAQGGTTVISPLDQKAGALVSGNGNMVQAPSSYDAQYEDLISWIRTDSRSRDRIIVISEKGAKQTEATQSLDSLLGNSGLTLSRFSYSILEGRNIVGTLGNLMTQDGVNRVVINSESGAFLYDVVRNLNLILHNKIEIVLYSPARIRSFDTIEVENLHNLNLHVSLSYYINYDDPRVEKFLMEYRALFGTEPSQFAYQGYDVASYFIRSAVSRGWERRLATRNREPMLQSDFYFVHEDDGGYANQGIRRVVYEKDYSLNLLSR